MRVFLAAVLSILIATPAAAQYGQAGASMPNFSAQKANKKAKATSSYAQQYRGSRYSANPAYDVYVNGQYVGSDPDPRIRATLAHEYRSDSGMR